MGNITALRNVLAGLYPTQQDTRRVVADAGLNPAYIQFSDKAINNWHDILTEAEKHGGMDALLTIVLNEYGRNPELINAVQAYGTTSPPRSTSSGNPSSPTYNINTGGGTFVAGNVNTGGGDFVGRDSTRHDKPRK